MTLCGLGNNIYNSNIRRTERDDLTDKPKVIPIIIGGGVGGIMNWSWRGNRNMKEDQRETCLIDDLGWSW